MVEMLKISYKNLYGRGILTKEEYNKKMKMYRPDEFMEMPKAEYEAKIGKAPAPAHVGVPVDVPPIVSVVGKKKKGLLD
jgi:hypothetical protein